MKHVRLAMALTAALVGGASATTLFSENFEGTLSAWSPSTYTGLGASGAIVADPVQADKAVHFGILNAGGDIISTAGNTSASGTYKLYFDYLGLPGQGGIPGDLGGFIGYSYGFPGTHAWLGGTITGYGTPIEMIDDGAWHSYSITFTAGAGIHVILEDFSGSAGVPGDAYFDNITLTDGDGPSPAAVPEPSTLGLMGLGLVSMVAAFRRNRAAQR